MRLKATKDFTAINHGSAIVPIAFLSGVTYVLKYLSPHNQCPADEEPTEENTMAGWVLGGSGAVSGLKQSSKDVLEAVLEGKLVPQP